MESISLEPVDSLTVTTLVDNVTDLLMVDEGPAKRAPMAMSAYPSVPARFLEGGRTGDALRAEQRVCRAEQALGVFRQAGGLEPT